MLEFIRERAKGIVAWVIVGLIAIPFALWGINNYFTGPSKVVVAEVNGEEIDASEFLRMYQRQKQQLQQQFGDLFEQLVDDKELRRQILDRLIEMKLIQQWTQSHGMAISDAQLAMVIQSAPIFLDEQGQFDQKKYEQILAANGLSVAQFEQLQRLSLLEQQYRNLTAASALALPVELDQLVALQQQQRQIGWLVFDMKPYLAQVQLTDEDLKAYYEAHKEEFIEPEKVIAEYVLLDKRTLAKQVKPTQDELERFYQDNQDLFTVAEQRQARHILILAKQGDSESEAAAQKKIAEIQAKLEAGEPFAKLAQTYSEDPGSAAVGGDLGWFEQGTMVPAFDEKVFSMKKGEISEPVQTRFGYHLIQLLDIKPKQTQPFTEVKERVEQLYRQQQADKAYYELQEAMNTQAYEQPDSLDAAAEAIGAAVETSKPVTREHGEGIFANPKVRQTLFSDEVFKQRLNSQLIELGPDRAVVVRVKEVIPSRQLTFAEVKARIAEQLRQARAQAAAEKAAKALLTQLKAGKPVREIKPANTQWHGRKWVSRQDESVPPVVLTAAFKAPKPVDNQPVWILVKDQGAPILVEVAAVRAGDSAVAEVVTQQLKQAVASIFADAEVQARIAQLKQAADIEIYPAYETVK